MQVQPLPSAWKTPSEPIARSEGQDMAECDAHLASATTHMAQGRSGCNALLGDKLPTTKLRHLNKNNEAERVYRSAPMHL